MAGVNGKSTRLVARLEDADGVAQRRCHASSKTEGSTRREDPTRSVWQGWCDRRGEDSGPSARASPASMLRHCHCMAGHPSEGGRPSGARPPSAPCLRGQHAARHGRSEWSGTLIGSGGWWCVLISGWWCVLSSGVSSRNIHAESPKPAHPPMSYRVGHSRLTPESKPFHPWYFPGPSIRTSAHCTHRGHRPPPRRGKQTRDFDRP